VFRLGCSRKTFGMARRLGVLAQDARECSDSLARDAREFVYSGTRARWKIVFRLGRLRKMLGSVQTRALAQDTPQCSDLGRSRKTFGMKRRIGALAQDTPECSGKILDPECPDLGRSRKMEE
jgi:hypothetical protein